MKGMLFFFSLLMLLVVTLYGVIKGEKAYEEMIADPSKPSPADEILGASIRFSIYLTMLTIAMILLTGGEKMNIRDELEEVVRHSYIVDSVATSLSNDMGDLMDAVYRLRCCAERAMAELKQLEGKNKKNERDEAAEAAMEEATERREKSGFIGHYGGLPDRGW